MFVITNLNTMIFICKCLNMHGVIIYVIYYKPIVYTFLLIKLRQKSEIFSTKPCIYCITPYIFILIAHYKPILYINRLFKSLINKIV